MNDLILSVDTNTRKKPCEDSKKVVARKPKRVLNRAQPC